MYERFMQLLQANNITPYRVSKETGVTQTTLSDWKTGRATPKTATLQKIADYFNVSLDWLTGEDIEFDVNPRECEDATKIKCPICQKGNDDNYVHFQKTIGVNFNNEKSSGIAIKFRCEEGHDFYYVFESYKGNTYAIQTDDSTIIAKPINEPIYENAPVSLDKLWDNDQHEDDYIKKYRTLDTYGQKAVSAVLDIEYERCTNVENTTVNTARIAAYGGGTKDIPAANVTKEELEQLEALQRGLNEAAEIDKKLRK